MSNNDLRCRKCGCQHHPVECSKDGDWLKNIIISIISCPEDPKDYNRNEVAELAQAIRAGIESRLPDFKSGWFKWKITPDYMEGYNKYRREAIKALLGKGE